MPFCSQGMMRCTLLPGKMAPLLGFSVELLHEAAVNFSFILASPPFCTHKSINHASGLFRLLYGADQDSALQPWCALMEGCSLRGTQMPRVSGLTCCVVRLCSVCPSGSARRKCKMKHFPLTGDGCWAGLALFLGVANRTNFMLGGFGHSVIP